MYLGYADTRHRCMACRSVVLGTVDGGRHSAPSGSPDLLVESARRNQAFGRGEPMFLLKKILAGLVLPPTGPLLLLLGGLVLWKRLPRTGRALAWSGTAGLLLLSLPVVAAALSVLVCDADALTTPDAADAQAIVILGSGMRADATEYGADAPSAMTLERLRYGAHLAKRTGLPVLVSGGRSSPAIRRPV